ncbi:MAG TPA: PqqD family protein [Paenibacillus sp.]|nr:PqqD family protein [Paenibacillus sp.]
MFLLEKHYRPARSSDIVFQSMPPDTILLNLKTGYYFSTNRLGADVWERCDGNTTVAAMIEDLHRRYDVELERLTEDVESFLRQMIDEELLYVEGRP